jgi:hypothetical protein
VKASLAQGLRTTLDSAAVKSSPYRNPRQRHNPASPTPLQCVIASTAWLARFPGYPLVKTPVEKVNSASSSRSRNTNGRTPRRSDLLSTDDASRLLELAFEDRYRAPAQSVA